MSALREIIALFEVSVNATELDLLDKKLDSAVNKLKGFGAAFAEFRVIGSVIEFGQNVAKAAREVEFSAGRMEMGTDEYQRMSQVAAEYGMTVENLQIANTLFVRALGNAGGVMGVVGTHSRHASAAMHSLGLNAEQFKGQRLEQILPTIADAMLTIKDPLERVTAGLNLFGHRGRSIMPMLAQGGDALRRSFAAAVPVFEEATIASADRATIAGMQLSRTWDNLINNSFGRALLDAMTWVSRKLTDIVIALKELSKNSEIGKAVLVTLSIAAVAAAGMIIAAWWPVLVPILAVLAAFAAVALIIDDLIVFMEGGKSVTGDILDRIFGEGGAEAARQKINELWEQFKAFVADLSSQGWKGFLEDTKNAVADVVQLFHDIKAAIQWIEEHWAKMRDSFDSVAHMFGGGSHDVKSTTTVEQALTSPTFQPGSVAPAPEIGPPTAAQFGQYGPNTTAKPGDTYVIQAIDGAELARKVGKVVDDHNNDKLTGVLRDALAGAGGAR